MRLTSFLRKFLLVSTRRRAEADETGTTLIELVVYIAILTIMTVIILRSVLQLTGVFARSRIERRVSLAAETALERIVREIRLAKNITCISTGVDAVCDTTQPIEGDSIRLDTYLSHSDSTPQFKTFYCPFTPCTQVMFDPNNPQGSTDHTDAQQLTPNTVIISNLIFKQLYNPGNVSASRGAVRIEMTVTSGSGLTQVTHTYYATAVLRGGY
ncbi:MAG: hypothetical protein AAB372_03980 [Patescibacteria group bacterium]